MPELSYVAIGAITTNRLRHRKLRPELVDQLSVAIEAEGLIQPIIVDGKLDLIAGLHRMRAVERLGFTQIASFVYDGIDALDAERLELSENFNRGELTPAEHTLHLARLKEIAEEIHRKKMGPKVPHQVGAALKPHPSGSASAAAVAKDTGQSRTAVDRASFRVNEIGADNVAAIAGTSLDKGVELDALAKLPAAERSALVTAAAAGKKVTAQAPKTAASALDEALEDAMWKLNEGSDPKSMIPILKWMINKFGNVKVILTLQAVNVAFNEMVKSL